MDLDTVKLILYAPVFGIGRNKTRVLALRTRVNPRGKLRMILTIEIRQEFATTIDIRGSESRFERLNFLLKLLQCCSIFLLGRGSGFGRIH